MVAVLKGDIIASRSLIDQDKWINPLKSLFGNWGSTPEQWELVWGDFFQVEIPDPEDALLKAIKIKSTIRRIEAANDQKKISPLDVRMAIGIGEKTYSGKTISQSNGPAFIYSGEKFETLKKENTNLSIQSPWQNFDDEINLYLKLAGIFMDKWTVSSAELIAIILENPNITQQEIGKKLGIKQSGVSGRWNRAHADEILEVEKMFRQKIKKLLL